MIAALDSAQLEFASIVGASHVVTDDATCQSLAVDGLAPNSVLYPQSAEQVAAVLKCAARRNLAVIPSRNATKLGIGNRPRRYDVALSLKQMTNVSHYEPADLTVSVEPGIKLGDLQSLLARDGLWMPLDPLGGARASVGGILAANASGPLRFGYGGPRDMVLGMKIATTDGKIVSTGGRVVKNVAGYDLSKLLLGSFGTLGVIVAAHLKLFPLPAERATFAFRISSLNAARDLRRRILDSPLTPMRMVFLDAEAARLLVEVSAGEEETSKSIIWVEAGGSKRVVERYARTFQEMSKVVGAPFLPIDPGQSNRGWQRIADFRACLAERYPGVVVLKTLLPIAHCEEFVSRARLELETAKCPSGLVAQTGVGKVHVCLLEPGDIPRSATLIQALRSAANEFRGVLVVEHCAPELKACVNVWGEIGNDYEIMRRVKQAWDSKGILSPGRLVGSL